MPGLPANEIDLLPSPGSEAAEECREDGQRCLELAQGQRRQVEQPAPAPRPERPHARTERGGARAEHPGEGPTPADDGDTGPTLRRDRREIREEMLRENAPASGSGAQSREGRDVAGGLGRAEAVPRRPAGSDLPGP